MYERFVQLLQENNMTAYRVAKETGVTQTTLSDWKTARATPKTATLQKIADFFNVSLDWLTGKTKYRNNQAYKDYNWGVENLYFEAPFDFCPLLKDIREEQDISVSDMCKVIDCTEEQYVECEEGILPITYEQAEKLCEHLGTNVSQVLFENQLYDDEVPEEYHDDVRAWEKLKAQADEEAAKDAAQIKRNITNPDILMIARAGEKMTPEQAENLRKYAQYMFPEAFKND